MNWGRISEGWISMDYVVLDKAETKPAEPKPTEPKPTEPKPTEPEETKPEEKPEETKPEESKPAETKLTGTVKVNDGLSVRRGAGTSYGILRYLSNGTKVTIVEVTEVNGTKWGNIGDGWVCMDYVVLDSQKEEAPAADTKTVIADCLRVRKEASTSAEIVGYYYEGAKVQILETKEVDGTKWGRTSKGWVSMDYVK